MNLTFKMDCELNNEGDWISKGHVVSVATNLEPSYANKQLTKGSVPVIITEAYTEENDIVTYEPYVEWFSVDTFEESI